MRIRVAILLVVGVPLLAASASAQDDEVRAAIDAANAKMVADYAAGDSGMYLYSRYGNPTVTAVAAFAR